jgi:PAS domain-containing protein
VLHELFAAVPVPVAYLAGPELVFEFANDAYRRLVGRQDLIGRPLGEALADLAAQGRAELIAAVLESGQPFQGYETELLVPRSGSSPEQVFVECLYQPVRGAGGRADGVLLLVSDVTAQVLDRRAQEALATQLAVTQERYRTLFETLPQGVIYYDTNGLILGVNPAACQILGLEEAVGHRAARARGRVPAGAPRLPGPGRAAYRPGGDRRGDRSTARPER